MAIGASLSLLSAYGAACVAWDESRWVGPFGFIATFAPTHQVSNILTWIVAFALGFLIYTVVIRWSWAYLATLITSAVGFISGLIPALMYETGGFTTDFAGITSPHWARTFANLLVVIAVAVLIGWNLYQNKSFKTLGAGEGKTAGNIARQLAVMSAILFGFAFVSFFGTHFLADMHIVQGVNIWELIDLQYFIAWTNLIGGISLLSGGLIMYRISPTKSLTTTSE